MLATGSSLVGGKTVEKRPKFKDSRGYDRAFQARMLRTLYQDPDYACSVGVYLNPEHFDRYVHRWFARQLLTYAKKHGSGITKDAIKIAAKAETRTGRFKASYAPELQVFLEKLDLPVKDMSYIREEMYHFVKHQTTREAILEAVDHLDTGDEEAIDACMSRVLEVQASMGGGLGHFYVRDVKKRTKRRKEYEKNGIPSGMVLDDHLKPGGLPPKAIGVVIAPTGKGKSHILVNLGRAAILDGKKVLHVTLELPEETIQDRYDASFTGVTLNALEDRAGTINKAVTDLGSQFGEFLVVKEFPPVTLTVSMLRAYIRQLERIGFYPDLVIVDYADLMLPSVSRDSMYEDQGNIYLELIKLAKELRVAVWTAAQTQRGALDKEHIDIDTIAESFKKMMHADLVILFCQTQEEKRVHKRARIFIGKNRFGPDKIEYKVRPDWSRSQLRAAA